MTSLVMNGIGNLQFLNSQQSLKVIPIRPTPHMLAVLEHLAEVQDAAVVRLYSQWWVRASDSTPSNQALSREGRDLSGQFRSSGSKPSPVDSGIVLIPTATVKAMERRGLLTMVGRKKPVLSGTARRQDHWRAELTPAGTALRATLENQAERIYISLLRRVTDAP